MDRNLAKFLFNRFKGPETMDKNFLDQFDAEYIKLLCPSEYSRGTKSFKSKDPLKGKMLQTLFMVIFN